MRRAPGWWWRFPLLMVLVGGSFVALTPVGWVLAHASDAVFGCRGDGPG